MTAWSSLAAVCEAQAGQAAESVAVVEVFVNGLMNPVQLCLTGPVSIERFGTTSLFRIIVHNDNMTRNKAVLCLPPDCMWMASKPRKVKGKQSGLRAIESVIELPTGNREGYDNLRITMPYDGDGGSAMLFAEAVVWASQEVAVVSLPCFKTPVKSPMVTD